MPKEIQNVRVKLRNVNKKQLGITIPADIQKKLGLAAGMEMKFSAEFAYPEKYYQCGVCLVEFSEAYGIQPECPGCGESNHIIDKTEAEEEVEDEQFSETE